MTTHPSPDKPAVRADPADEVAELWMPSPWVMRISALAAAGVIWIACVLAIILCMAAWSDSEWPLPSMLATFVVLGAATTAIHELGHLAAGRLAGMHLIRVQVGFIDALATRRGWRVRLKRPQFVHGMVVALPDLSRPLSTQLAQLAAGGPAANLLIAVIAGVGATFVPPSAMAVLAVMNAGVGIGNLLPTHKHLSSDGLTLLQLMKRRAFARTSLAFLRLNAMAMSGATADRLPIADIETLATGAPVERLFALWFHLKAAQGRGDFAQAKRMADELQSCLDTMNDIERRACAPLAGLIRGELAFSAVLSGTPPERPLDADLDPEIDWIAPAVRLRLRALDAVIRGESAAAAKLLDQAETASERSADAAHRESERSLRARVRQFAGHSSDAYVRAEEVAVG
jgi:hypothetical protein